MRWPVLVALVACSRQAPAPTIASHHEARVEVARTTELATRSYRELELVELPPLPAKRGIDLGEEKTCRAHYRHVQRIYNGELGGSDADRTDDVRRLARVAIQAGGDCRIDTDALFASEAPYHFGGCRGVSPREGVIAWTRVAAVASTPARRAAALHNLASVAWMNALRERHIDPWIDAGTAYVRAAQSDPSDRVLSGWAVDAFENALRTPLADHVAITREQVLRIDRMLAHVSDGQAADRARALRARISY
jgi:hypothetical protein